ncbi:MAG: FAD-dependent oxidoreductase [Bacteroidetes bacterium]|nr:FAD-dependent oxidoreductase [Bacteroidota bacterium]
MVAQDTLRTEILVVGGGVGGTAAGIQAARLGRQVIITEATTWLGGMLTAAGVSAVDGNHSLPSGLWAEFRNALYTKYGGEKKVSTGWVSNTLFEPHIGDSIFKSMAARLPNLKVLFRHQPIAAMVEGENMKGAVLRNLQNNRTVYIFAQQVIDATELGDLLEMAKLPYDIGMEANRLTGENIPVAETNDIIQDLTYVAILKTYGAAADCTIAKPVGYNPAEFDGSCTNYYKDLSRKAPGVDAKKMLDYGKLPNNKYMLNWPIFGNDTYLNVIQLSDSMRQVELSKARQTTLRFVYFIQHELGFKNLGLTDDEFPTEDKLALIPYHREGRRVKGIVRFKIQHIANPYNNGEPLYRTGISVGDYPVDHHHKKNPLAPQHLDFYPVPSFTIPLGALLPANMEGLIVAEKAISVSNLANGTTRLQPCVLLTGQAAGTLAALSVQQGKANAADVAVRLVQASLLQQGAYLMPYYDVPAKHPQFEAVQRIGATGILRGTGKPNAWANQTWFYPDSLIRKDSLLIDLQPFTGKTISLNAGEFLTGNEALAIVKSIVLQNQVPGSSNTSNPPLRKKQIATLWKKWGFGLFNSNQPITRVQFAKLLDTQVNPFDLLGVNLHGQFQPKYSN